MNENRSYLERRSGNTSSKKWASRTPTKPSRGKCQQPFAREAGAGWLQSSFAGQDLRALVENRVAVDQQHLPAATAWAALAQPEGRGK